MCTARNAGLHRDASGPCTTHSLTGCPTPSSFRSASDNAEIDGALDAMVELGLSKIEMAQRMGTGRSQLDRLLDLDNDRVPDTVQKAASAVGKRVSISLEEDGAMSA